MSYITIAQEKKEFIARHFDTIGIKKVEDLVTMAFRSSRIKAVVYFILAMSFFIGQLFFPREIAEFIIRNSGQLIHSPSGMLVVTKILLILAAILFFWLFSRANKTRKSIEKDFKTLRILVDYMRIGKKHFVEVCKAIVPEGTDADYEYFADRLFKTSF